MRTLVVFLTMLLIAAVQASTSEAQASGVNLRTAITVRGEMVRLSDLFAGLQPGQDCDIGPSPAPGKRIAIPPSQLAAIASEFGIDWEPGLSYQSATLERLGRIVTREEVLAILKPALVGAGAASGSDLSLAAFVSPVLPIGTAISPQIQSLDFDAPTGRFTAILLFAGPGSDGMTIRLVGRAEEQTSVMALTHTLPAGALLVPDDLQMVRVRRNGLRGSPVTVMVEAEGMALKRSLDPGTPLLHEMLTRPMLIERGRPVVLRLRSSGLQLTAAGTALEAGGAGDRIHVINSLSHAILVGQVTGSAEVEIDPSTAPVIGKTIEGQNGLPRLPSGSSSAGARDFASYAQEAQN